MEHTNNKRVAMITEVIGTFRINEKEMEIRLKDGKDIVTLLVTDKGSDVPMPGCQINISKKELLVDNSHKTKENSNGTL